VGRGESKRKSNQEAWGESPSQGGSGSTTFKGLVKKPKKKLRWKTRVHEGGQKKPQEKKNPSTKDDILTTRVAIGLDDTEGDFRVQTGSRSSAHNEPTGGEKNWQKQTFDDQRSSRTLGKG